MESCSRTLLCLTWWFPWPTVYYMLPCFCLFCLFFHAFTSFSSFSNSSIVRKYHNLCIHSTADKHLGYFQLWTVAVNILHLSLGGVHAFLQSMYTQLALWGHAVSMLISCRYCQFLKLTVPICTTPAMHVSPVLHILDLWNIIRICTIDILVYVQKYLMVEFDFSWWLMRLSTCSRDYLPFGHSLLLNTSSLARFMMSCVSFSYSSYILVMGSFFMYCKSILPFCLIS